MEEENKVLIGNIDKRPLDCRSILFKNMAPSNQPLLGSGIGSFQVWKKPYFMNFLDGTNDEGKPKSQQVTSPPSDYKILGSSNRGDDGTHSVDLSPSSPVETENVTTNGTQFKSGHVNNKDKRYKRIISNRESAQRCRRRKAQYVEDMQQKVRDLEAQIAALSPQLLLYQNQNNFLQMEQENLSKQISLYETNGIIQDVAIADKKAEVNRLRRLHYELQEHYLHKHSRVLSYLEPDEYELSAADLGLNQYELEQFVFPNYSNPEDGDINSSTSTELNGLNQFININMTTEEQEEEENSHGDALNMSLGSSWPANTDHGDKQVQIPIWATPKTEPQINPNWTYDEADA